MSEPRFSNRLKDAISPYLLQHAGNPVDWFPWGGEALDRAKSEDKPIFLSIGYSSCHWCHVMAHESFENETIARQMNAQFINIKVDREERPDLDAIYMKSVLALTGQGGWPMSVFLTPDQEPYFGGTYFPPTPTQGRPGFPQILDQAHDLYHNHRERLQSNARKLMETLNARPPVPNAQGVHARELMEQFFNLVLEKYDETYGGFGSGIKFPEPMLYALLLRHWVKSENNDCLLMIDKSLTGMAEGGLYDQLGGGFHRYSTDRMWRVPHFEKMLHDNALLADLYLGAYQATKQEIYERIPREIFEYVEREMTSPEGAFYSSQDADTEGGEGRYFTWEMKEVLDLLGPRHAKVFARTFGITPTGNFEKRNVLHITAPLDKVCEQENVAIFEADHIIKNGKQALLEARNKRTAPGRDQKILAAWNGMMIAALSNAYRVLGDDAYRERAERAAHFLWERMRDGDDLLRVYKDGRAKVPGFLEDYAWACEAFLALYEAHPDTVWIDRTCQLADRMLDLFWDERDGGFFITSKQYAGVVSYLKNPEDEAVPSPNAVAIRSLIKLGRLTGRENYLDKARAALNAFQDLVEHRPTAYGGLLSAMDLMESLPMEIVLSGPEEDPAYQEMQKAVFQDYRPNKMVVRYQGEETVKWVPWAEGRGAVSGKPTAYVCKEGTCHPPVHDADSLSNLLGRPPMIYLNIFDDDKKVKDLETKEQANFLNAMSDIFKHSGLGKKD